MEPLYKYLEGVFGLTFLAWVVLGGLLVFLTWKIAQRYALAKYKADNLPCEKHEKGLGDLGIILNDVKVTLGKLETGQEDVYRMMSLIAGTSTNASLTQSHSPISLTEKGEIIAKELGFEKILDDNWGKISKIIDTELNPYDIQMKFITELILRPSRYIDNDSLDAIKNDAFNKGLPLIDYMRMTGVLARDRYFREHGIDVADVDRIQTKM